jgi:hypothetical protein
MAVLFQAQGAIASSTGADVTPVWPTHQANDIGIAHVFYRSQSPTTATPSGWTLLEGPYDGSASTRHYWFWKRAAGASETDPLMDKSAATGDTYACIYTVRGALSAGNPFEDTQTSAHTTADPFAAGGVTSLTAGALIFAMVADADDAASDFSVTATDPAAFSQDSNTSTTGGDALMGQANANRASAGATGDLNINWQNAPDGGAILVVAIGETAAGVTGSIASSLQRALFTATGTHTSETSGAIASILQAATFSGTGAHPYIGSMASTMQAATFSGTGLYTPPPPNPPNSQFAPMYTADALYRPIEVIGARLAPVNVSEAQT